MKTTFSVPLVTQQGGFRSAYFKIDLPFAPSMEMQFNHPVWKEGRKPVSVELNLEQLSFHVQFMEDLLPNKDTLDKHCEMYKSHGWKFVNDP